MIEVGVSDRVEHERGISIDWIAAPTGIELVAPIAELGDRIYINPTLGTGLVDRLSPLRAGSALGDHQHPDRLDRAVPALRRAVGLAGLRGPGGADRVKGVGLALPARVLPVRAVHLHNPDAGRGDVAARPAP